MSHSRRRAWRVSALVGVAGLMIAACGSSSSNSSGQSGSNTTVSGGSAPTLPPPIKVTGNLSGPGVTATTITIGQIATISGPVPGLFQGSDDGLDAWVAYINAHGGIDGRTVKILRKDDGFNCTTYTQTLKQYASEVFAMVGTFTLEDTCGKSVLRANPNLPDVQGSALDPSLYSLPNVFAPAPNPPGFQTTGYLYFKSRFGNDIQKSAAIYATSAAANGKEQQLAAESVGYKYVYTDVISDFDTNFTSDILRMKRLGVKIVDMDSDGVTMVAEFLAQAAQQNFHPDALLSAAGYDASLNKLLGNTSLANNVLYSPLPYPLYLGTDRNTVPAVNTFLTWLDNAHPGDTANIYSVSSWAAGTLLLDAMAKAGSNITQASVVTALDGITNFNSDGLIAPSNPGKRIGTHCIVIAGFSNGSWSRVDPSSGFICNGTYDQIPLSEIG